MKARGLQFSGHALGARALSMCLAAAAITIAVALCSRVALAASIHPRFEPNVISGAPFPSDRFTVPDVTQITGRRVMLPQPDCVTRPTDCAEVNMLNEFDGFNVSPRLSIPFDGPIDISTATSSTVFLVNLEGGQVSGIDQIVWDPPSMTLYVEAGEQLEQHTRYALVVTKSLMDPSGKAVKPAQAFSNFVDETITASTGDALL